MKNYLTNFRLILFSLFCGISEAGFYYLFVSNLWDLSKGKKVFSIIYLIILFSVLVWFVYRKILHLFVNFTNKKKTIIIICSLIFTLLFVCLVPLNKLPQQSTLEITATGEKNPDSLGSEVWIQSIIISPDQKIEFDKLSKSEGWEIKDKSLFSYQNQPASIKWSGWLNKNLSIALTSHPWSGKVLFRWNGTEQIVDLYSQDYVQKIIIFDPFKTSYNKLADLGMRIWVGISIVIFIFPLVILISCLLIRFYNKYHIYNSSWIMSLIISITLTYSIFVRIVSFWKLIDIVKIIIILPSVAILFLLMQIYDRKIITRIIINYPDKKKLLVLFICFLSSTILMLVIPVSPLLPPNEHELKIIATGHNNPLAKGHEVWISELSVQGKVIPVGRLNADKGWDIRDGVLYSSQDQQAVVSWKDYLYESGKILVTFVSHPWSGQVLVNLDGQETKVDLFSSTPSQKFVELELTKRPFFGSLLASSIISIISFLCDLITLALIMMAVFSLIIMRLLTSKNIVSSGKKENYSIWFIVIVATIIIAYWTMWLITFWPGFLSPDSVGQWDQITTNNIQIDHRSFHTAFLWLLTRISLTPATIGFSQIIAMVSVVMIWLIALRKKGLKLRTMVLATALIAISPMNSSLSITLWSDVFYAVFFALVCFCLYKMVVSDGLWIQTSSSMLLFSLSLFFMSAMRGNGLIVAVAVILFLFLFWKKEIKKISILAAIFGSLFLVSQLVVSNTGALYQILIFPVYHNASAYVNEKTTLSDNEKLFLEEIRPIPWPYDCHDASSFFFDGKTNEIYLKDNMKKLKIDMSKILVFWYDKVLQDPIPFIKHQICVSSLTWKISKPTYHFSVGAFYVDPDHEIYFTQDAKDGKYKEFYSKTPLLLSVLGKWYNLSQEPQIFWLFWSPGFWLIISVFSVIIIAIREKNYKYSILLTPLIVTSISIALLTASQEYRYQFCVVVIGMIYLFLIWCRTK